LHGHLFVKEAREKGRKGGGGGRMGRVREKRARECSKAAYKICATANKTFNNKNKSKSCGER
jgi:hypothetical protein